MPSDIVSNYTAIWWSDVCGNKTLQDALWVVSILKNHIHTIEKKAAQNIYFRRKEDSGLKSYKMFELIGLSYCNKTVFSTSEM